MTLSGRQGPRVRAASPGIPTVRGKCASELFTDCFSEVLGELGIDSWWEYKRRKRGAELAATLSIPTSCSRAKGQLFHSRFSKGGVQSVDSPIGGQKLVKTSTTAATVASRVSILTARNC